MHFPSAAVPCVSPFSRKLQVWFHPAGQNPGQIPHPVLSLPPAIPARSRYPVVTFYKNSAWTAPMQPPALPHSCPVLCISVLRVLLLSFEFRLLWLSLLSIVWLPFAFILCICFFKNQVIFPNIYYNYRLLRKTDTPAQTFQVSVATCLSERAYSFSYSYFSLYSFPIFISRRSVLRSGSVEPTAKSPMQALPHR